MSYASCSTESIRVATIDDHPPIRETLQHRLEDSIDMEGVGSAATAGEAAWLIEEERPDVAVVEVLLGDRAAFDLIKSLRDQCPGTQVLVFTTLNETVYAERALRAGASGYLMKEAPVAELLTAVREVAEGRTYLSPKMTARVLLHREGDKAGEARFPIDELTSRERQVFQMLGQGRTIESVAERLGITRKTAETHRRKAKEKLGYDSVDQVISHAAQWNQAERHTDSAQLGP